MSIDTDELRKAIQEMKGNAVVKEKTKLVIKNRELYLLLKEELSKWGNWKNSGRGKPKAGGNESKISKINSGLVMYLGISNDAKKELLSKCPFQLHENVQVKETGEIGEITQIYYNGYCFVEIPGNSSKGSLYKNNCTYRWEELRSLNSYSANTKRSAPDTSWVNDLLDR